VPATAEILGKMLALCPDSLISRRGPVRISLGFTRARSRRDAEKTSSGIDRRVDSPKNNGPELLEAIHATGIS
jgi:hypothetical protein